MLRPGKVKHPEWLDEAKIAHTYQIYRDGRFPERIEAWMLATPLRHDLRAIYGGDLALIAVLLRDAVRDRWILLKSRIEVWLGLVKPEEVTGDAYAEDSGRL